MNHLDVCGSPVGFFFFVITISAKDAILNQAGAGSICRAAAPSHVSFHVGAKCARAFKQIAVVKAFLLAALSLEADRICSKDGWLLIERMS